MGLQPNIKREQRFKLRTCPVCGQSFGPEGFAPTKSIFYPDGVIPICNDCVEQMLEEHEYDWEYIDKLCQYADIPFVPAEWERLKGMNEQNVFGRYAEVFLDSQYENLGWGDYFKEFCRLREAGHIEDELPEVSDEKRKKQKEHWGHNYDDEALDYLDNLYNGLMTTQNVNGALQLDQATKICKISYEIDQKIAEGADFDKLLASYDKLVKTAEFTPKNVKNINDFDTTGELTKWMEKRGWRNKFYDDVPRDIVDETIMNLQNFNQKLYTNESGIGDEISHRLENLKAANQLDNYYDLQQYDENTLDQFDNAGYEHLVEDEEFVADMEDNDE